MRLVILAFLFLTIVLAAQPAFSEEEQDEYEDEEIEERAFLVVQKKVMEKEIPDGSNITMVLTLHNAGTRAALDIEIVDQTLPASVLLVGDTFDMIRIDKLNPGLSATYKGVVAPSTPGKVVFGPAKISYTPIYGSAERQTVLSTSTSVLVLTTNEYLVSKILLMGSYVTLGVLKTQKEWIRFGIFAGVLFLFFSLNYLWKKLSDARRERMRRKATEALEKEK